MSKKKLVCLLLSAALLAFTACTPAAGQQSSQAPTDGGSEGSALSFTPGSYTGEAEGYGGTLKLEVTVDESSIQKVEVLEHSETDGIGSVAVERLPETIVSAQSLGVDTITGCTVSSTAILDAAKAALADSGVDMAKLTAAPEKQAASGESVSLETGVVILGAGGAGMTAAIKLLQEGVDVIVVEKMAYVGGATAMSSSSALAQGTRTQVEAGVEDSPELCFMDLMRVGEFQNDPVPTWLLSSHSGRAIDWLSDDMGVEFADGNFTPSAEYTVGRARSSVTGSGAGLTQDLRNKMEDMGAELMMETEAYALTDENGTVNGVLARGQDGTEYTIKADAVIIATGGYCYNEKYIPTSLLSLPNSGSVANTGDGIAMALPYGAVLQNMEMVAVAGHGIRKGDSAQHTKPGSTAAYRTTGTILVNMDGERFVNERGSDASVVAAMRETDRSFMLMDAEAFATYSEDCVKKGYFSQAELDQWLEENGNGNSSTVMAHGETLEEVAAAVGMDAAGLKATVEAFNGYVAADEDPDFGRALVAPIGEGTYYLVEQCLRYSTTLGGLTINENMQLVTENNQPIPGLYAAGEVIGGVFGASFPPSSGVGWALTSGMLAGEEIVKALD